MGQNIRGFRGWRSDHEYFTHEWSDLAYLYLQCKQQPRKYYPQNVSILLNHEYFVPRKLPAIRYTPGYMDCIYGNVNFMLCLLKNAINLLKHVLLNKSCHDTHTHTHTHTGFLLRDWAFWAPKLPLLLQEKGVVSYPRASRSYHPLPADPIGQYNYSFSYDINYLCLLIIIYSCNSIMKQCQAQLLGWFSCM